ncbi:MAG: DUF4783 domain-containing protein [Bacteroidota bacterium]
MKMLRYIALLTFALWIGVGELAAQAPNNAVLNEATESLIYADANRIARLFSQRVEITINGRSQLYDRTQAKLVIARFFKENPPVGGFTVKHKGNSGNTLYALGTYRSAKGKYDVNLYFRFSNNNSRLSEIRFDM